MDDNEFKFIATIAFFITGFLLCIYRISNII